MKTGLSQHTSMRQELKINPRLYQAMDLLYMPLLDLQQHLKQELLINPFLELIEPEDEEAEDEPEAEGDEEPNDMAAAEVPAEEPKKDSDGEIDWEEILLDGFDTGGQREQHEEKEYYEPVTVERQGLDDHLRDQVTLLDLTPRQKLLAEEFIGNINDDGYLACSIEELLEGINEVIAKAAEAEGLEGELPFYTVQEAE
jgi:RNA polymerase sigma-54 factor